MISLIGMVKKRNGKMKEETRLKRGIRKEAKEMEMWIKDSHKIKYTDLKRIALEMALISNESMKRKTNWLVNEILEDIV